MLENRLKEVKNIFNDIPNMGDLDIFGNPVNSQTQTPSFSTAAATNSNLDELAVGNGKDPNAVHSDVRGMWIGATEFSMAPFRVDMLGNAVLESLTVVGAIIRAGKTSMIDLVNAGTYIDVHGLFVGNSGDSHSFKFDADTGELVIKGAEVDGSIITDIQMGTDLALQSWQLSSLFSATDYRKAAWTAGTLTFQDGQAFSISAGDTGNMTALTYIYFDKAFPTVLKVTATPTTALGANKLLVAVANINADTTSKASIQAFGGSGGASINADQIAANGVTAGAIRAGAVLASKLSVAAQKQNHTVAFTTTFPDYCAWTSGTIFLADGTTIAIDAGNTGRLAAIIAAWTAITGTLALWHFDEASGSVLDNVEGDASWDITCTGTSVVTGKFTNGRNFNGTSDYATIADYSEMDQDVFSLEGWFKCDAAVTTKQFIISRSYTSASATARYFDVYVENKKLYATLYQYDSSLAVYYPYILISNYNVDDTAWHHFRLTYSKTAGEAKLYVDGYLHNQITSAGLGLGLRASARPILIGKSDLAVPGYFDGVLDEFRFSNVVIDPTVPAERYIYYDQANTSTLQVGTDKSTIVGDTKILLCTMTPQMSGSGAALEVMSNTGTTITGSAIKTGVISSADGKNYFDLNNGRQIINDGVNDRVIIGRFQ